MEWLKNKFIQFYLWWKPNLKRVRLSVLAWSTRASVSAISIYHDEMLAPRSGLSVYLLSFITRSKQHLFNNRWERIDTNKSVGILFADYFDWTILPRDMHPDNIYYDLVNRVENDALVMVIEIGREDPGSLTSFIHSQTTELIHYPHLVLAGIDEILKDDFFNRQPATLYTVFGEMYRHCFIHNVPPVEYKTVQVFRHDGMLFILFDS